jgi:hypothetical protein
MTPDVPQHPPLEIIKQGSLFVVEEYRQGARSGKTFASHDTQMSALRYAKSKMEADGHPCIVRWDSQDSVGGLYWNPLFECLTVRQDDLVEAWTVVPREGTCAMTAANARSEAADRAKQLQRLYDFKHLRVYDGRGEEYEERTHRFLRYDITNSGVRFDSDAVTTPPASVDPTPDEEPEPASETSEVDTVGPAAPGQLGASIPDVTKVEFVDTDGAVHRYATPWDGGTQAEIVTVSSKHASDEAVREAVAEIRSRWTAVDDRPYVASVYESGTDPTPWVAYRVGNHTLADVGTELPARSRLDILGQVADAARTVADGSMSVCGLRPSNVHLLEQEGSRRATVADWGLEWAVREAVGLDHGGPFLAPEQTGGQRSPTTAVYQLGALAHWLLCEQLPPDAPSPRPAQLPRPVGDFSSPLKAVISRSLAADPAERQESVSALYRALTDAA